MNNIWLLQTPLPTHFHLAVPTDDCETPIVVTQFLYVDSEGDSKMGIYGGHVGERPSPAAELTMRREDFDADYFTWGGCIFVSERMRQAMALDASEVRFFEVDTSQSAPLPRSKNYQMMEPTMMEDVLDPEKSQYDAESIPPDDCFGPLEVNRIAVRPDVTPTHDLFYDGFFSSILLCTDRFAMRVLRAGCTGMVFVDPNGYGGLGVSLRRTLRGIEELVGWDGISKVETTKLVQTID